MNDYIERRALLDELCRDNCERTYDGTCHNCRMIETIADFPAADVEPVVHGKWVKAHWKNSVSCANCSICGLEAYHYDFRGVQKTYDY